MTSPLSPSILWGGTLLIKYDVGSIWTMEYESTFFLHTHFIGCKAALPILVMVPRSQSNMMICSMPLLGWKLPCLLVVIGCFSWYHKETDSLVSNDCA